MHDSHKKVSVKQTFISVTDRVCFYLVIKLEQEEKNIFVKKEIGNDRLYRILRA